MCSHTYSKNSEKVGKSVPLNFRLKKKTCMSVCESASVTQMVTHLSTATHKRPEEGIKLLGIGVPEGFELPTVYAGNQTLVLLSSKYS